MIYYTGDIHGSAKGIVAFAQHYELTESDIIVILGDVGANYYGNRRDQYCKDALARIKPTVFCIHGNHERRPDTLAGYKQKEWNGGLVWYEDEYPNLLFASDGDIFTMEGTRHLVIGGAYSVDKYYRLENDLLWFADEQPSAEIKTDVEDYNLDKVEPASWALKGLAAALLPVIREFYTHEDNVRAFGAWLKDRESNPQKHGKQKCAQRRKSEM